MLIRVVLTVLYLFGFGLAEVWLAPAVSSEVLAKAAVDQVNDSAVAVSNVMALQYAFSWQSLTAFVVLVILLLLTWKRPICEFFKKEN